MYMNVHKTGFSAVFHISVMIFKLAHLKHLDLDHQNVFRQFHILFYQNQINSSIRYPVSVYPVSGIRLSGIRLSGIRYPSIRYPSIRYPSIRYPSIRYPSIRYPSIRYPSIRYPVPVFSTMPPYNCVYNLKVQLLVINFLMSSSNRGTYIVNSAFLILILVSAQQ